MWSDDETTLYNYSNSNSPQKISKNGNRNNENNEAIDGLQSPLLGEYFVGENNENKKKNIVNEENEDEDDSDDQENFEKMFNSALKESALNVTIQNVVFCFLILFVLIFAFFAQFFSSFSSFFFFFVFFSFFVFPLKLGAASQIYFNFNFFPSFINCLIVSFSFNFSTIFAIVKCLPYLRATVYSFFVVPQSHLQ